MANQDFMQPTSYMECKNGRRLAYVQHAGEGPCVVFLTGFKSDMTGQKALALEAWCAQQNRSFVRFDYSGHGQSSGAFEDGTIGAWTEDALAVIDQLTTGNIILVGSSMGGWIMLLAALARPERVAGLVGIAAAPDFTEALIWNEFNDTQKQQMQMQGYIDIPNCYGVYPYRITHQLIEEGRNHLLLHKPIPIHCPVRLLHGTKDEDVPWQVSQKLLEQLEGEDVQLTLVKDAGHRMSGEAELRLLCETVGKLI